MKILSLTEDQFRLLKNQYEDELELALKYIEDIRSILHKLNKQEGKIVKERKPGRKRRGRKATSLNAGTVSPEPGKKSKRGRKKRGRKPGSVVAKAAPAQESAGKKSKPGRKRGRKPGKAVKPVVAVKGKPGRKKRAIVKKVKSTAPKQSSLKSTEPKSAVKTFINPEVKKEV